MIKQHAHDNIVIETTLSAKQDNRDHLADVATMQWAAEWHSDMNDGQVHGKSWRKRTMELLASRGLEAMERYRTFDDPNAWQPG